MGAEMTEELIDVIADTIVEIGYRNTLSGNYHIDFSYVADLFNIPLESVIVNKSAIARAIDGNDKILSETWVEDDFDMNFCLND